jgi:hypothetical protein
VPKCDAMILGRTVFKRDCGNWNSEHFDSGAHSNAEAISRMVEIVSANRSTKASIIFEPEGITHESIETPNTNRFVFASLERVKNEHPVVSTTNLGWGIEKPEPIAGGIYSTLIHSEMAPGLIHLKDLCAQGVHRLLAAWSVYSVIEAIVKSNPSISKTRKGIVLTPKYVAVASYNAGRRSFRAWVGTMTERDWKEFSILATEADGKRLASAGDFESRRSEIIVISAGDPAQNCPIWSHLFTTGRVEKVMGMDDLAESAEKMPIHYPANLLDAFPTPRRLDRYLLTIAVTGISIFSILGVVARNDSKRYENAEEAVQQRLAELNTRLEKLKMNQRVMSILQRQILDGSEMLPICVHGEVMALTAAIPDAVTLTSLVICRNGDFEIEALIDRAEFNSERARTAFESGGLVPDKESGWKYDAADSRLRVRGKYLEVKQ